MKDTEDLGVDSHDEGLRGNWRLERGGINSINMTGGAPNV
jgi:hypothetical protein